MIDQHPITAAEDDQEPILDRNYVRDSAGAAGAATIKQLKGIQGFEKSNEKKGVQ